MSVSLRSWWVISARTEAEELRSRAENGEETIFSRFWRSLLAASPQKHSRSRTINTTNYTGYVGDESETKKFVFIVNLFKQLFVFRSNLINLVFAPFYTKLAFR